LIANRQGKIRLAKFYSYFSQKEKQKFTKEAMNAVLSRQPKHANFIRWRDLTICYKRYASLYFIVAVDATDNELITLEIIHAFVTLLDKYFQNVCELDIIYNFDQVHWVLDEFIVAGEVVDTSSKSVLNNVYRPEDDQRLEAISVFL
jgi:AP-1 complex subunit sigma 1/2